MHIDFGWKLFWAGGQSNDNANQKYTHTRFWKCECDREEEFANQKPMCVYYTLYCIYFDITCWYNSKIIVSLSLGVYFKKRNNNNRSIHNRKMKMFSDAARVKMEITSFKIYYYILCCDGVIVFAAVFFFLLSHFFSVYLFISVYDSVVHFLVWTIKLCWNEAFGEKPITEMSIQTVAYTHWVKCACFDLMIKAIDEIKFRQSNF